MKFGNKILLKANVVSLPLPSGIQWKKNTEQIDVDGIKFSEDLSEEHMVKLVISDLDFDDSGTYSISVTNAIGTNEDQTQIIVKPQGTQVLLKIV